MRLFLWVGGGLAIVAMAATAAMQSNASTNKMHDSDTQATLATESVCPAAFISVGGEVQEIVARVVAIESPDSVANKTQGGAVTTGTWRYTVGNPDSVKGWAADRTVIAVTTASSSSVAQTANTVGSGKFLGSHTPRAMAASHYGAAGGWMGSHTPRVVHTSAPVDFSTV